MWLFILTWLSRAEPDRRIRQVHSTVHSSRLASAAGDPSHREGEVGTDFVSSNVSSTATVLRCVAIVTDSRNEQGTSFCSGNKLDRLAGMDYFSTYLGPRGILNHHVPLPANARHSVAEAAWVQRDEIT